MGVDSNEVSDLIQIQDLFSTILEIAGTTPSNPVIDGQSIIGYLDAETAVPTARVSLYSELYSANGGIDRWAARDIKAKYITRTEDIDADDIDDFVEECYDLETDPSESQDQYALSGSITLDCDSLKNNRPL